MLLKDVLKGIECELIQGSDKVKIDNISYDSRKIKKNTAFIALTGSNNDGHDYITSAIENGAVAIFTEKRMKVTPEIPIILLKNTRKELSHLSINLFDNPSKKIKTIAITGTKGKTTTAWMIKTILETAGKKVGMIGTIGTFILDKYYENKNTTPESYEIQKYLNEMVEAKLEYVVMEVSSQALKYGRVDGINFDYGIFTNLTKDHISDTEHPDMEDYIYSKSLLFKNCKHGIFNIDDDHYKNMIANATCDIHTYGFNPNADLIIDNVEYIFKNGLIGINLYLVGMLKDTMYVNTPGKFSAYNATCAILTTTLLSSSMSDIKKSLKNFFVKGRVEPIKVSDKFSVLIDYAHNGISTESILTTIKEYKPGRIICLFGCGGNRSRDRRYEMGEVSGTYADLSIITEDNSRFEKIEDIIADILVGIKKTNGKYVVIPDRTEAIKYCLENAQENDVILLLGKGHETYQELNGKSIHFDEREVINKIIGKNFGGDK